MARTRSVVRLTPAPGSDPEPAETTFLPSEPTMPATVEHRPGMDTMIGGQLIHSVSTGSLDRLGDIKAAAISAPSSRPSSSMERPGGGGAGNAVDNYGDPDFPRVVIPAEVAPHPIVDGFVDQYRRKGVLIPLKTTLELRQDHTLVQAYITRAPTKAANNVVRWVVVVVGINTPLRNTADNKTAFYATCCLMERLTACLISGGAPSRQTCRRTSRHS